MNRAVSTIVASLLCLTAMARAPAQALEVEVLADGLENPWGLAFLPDGAMLLTERAGKLWRLDSQGRKLAEIANVPPSFVELQGGLFDVVLGPQFATDSSVYLSLAHGDRKHNTTRVVRATLVGNELREVKIVFESTPKGTAAHYGGRLAFLRDGTLLVTTGEGAEYREDAQRLKSTLGKIVRLQPDGSIPADNPFVGRDDADPAVWTYGHRNPQGLDVDPATGAVWSAEHGPRGGDEINAIVKGANYGWPIATHGLDYTGGRISPFETYPGVTEPLLWWTPSIGVGGVAVYRGALFPEWDGDLLAGAMGHQHLQRIEMDGGKVVARHRLLDDRKARFRQVKIGPEGAIYAVIDAVDNQPESGQLLRITPAR